MLLKLIFFSAFILFFSNSCFPQLIIKGKFEGITHNDKAVFFKPIEGYHNIYYDPIEIRLLSNDSFFIQFPLTESSFFNIKLPSANGILYLYSSPGDTINLYAKFARDEKGRSLLNSIVFNGNNSEGHKYYSAIKAKFTQQFLINNIFKNSKFTDFKQYVDNLLLSMDTIENTLNELHSRGAVSKEFVNHTFMDIASYCLTHILAIFNSFAIRSVNDDDSKMPENIRLNYRINKNLFTKENLNKLKLIVYQKYPPDDESIVTSGLGLMYSESYFKDIFEGVISKNIYYDSSFLLLCEDCKYYGYMNGKLLEYKWAKTLHWIAITETEYANLYNNLMAFQTRFPNSKLLPYLKERYSDALINASKNKNVKDSEIEFLNAEYKNLNQIHNINFKNKYLFIDLWATWCSPCIQEFIYKSSLDSLLDKFNVSLLYISIDKLNDRTKWENFVKYKRLNGFHLLANESLLENIKKNIFNNSGITIPRYLLLSPEGRIITTNLPRPSDITSLANSFQKFVLK